MLVNKALRAYKELISKIRLLPLDKITLEAVKAQTKQQFYSERRPFRSGVDSHRILKIKETINLILNDADLEKLTEVWDSVYKQDSPPWIQKFKNLSYTKFRDIWPQVHLVKEVAPNLKALKEYDTKITEEQHGHFSLMEFMDMSEPHWTFKMLVKNTEKVPDSDIDHVIKCLTKFHKFVSDNDSRITHLKIQPLEVIYPTNRYARPLHVSERERLLKKKVNYMKQLCNLHKPLRKGDLEHLINVATSVPNSGHHEINPAYFRFMERRRASQVIHMNPSVRHFLQTKKLVPNDNNIRKYLRQYVMKQYYIENGSYQMSWMQNFYEHSTDS